MTSPTKKRSDSGNLGATPVGMTEFSQPLDGDREPVPGLWTADVAAGMLRALPIVLGYLPVGLAYGALATKAGISAANTVLMSALVYGGASQFIAVGLLAAGAGVWAVILTTLIVNLRHLVMAAAVAPALAGWRVGTLAAFAAELTDETFALHVTGFGQRTPTRATVLTINLTAHAAWMAGTVLGILAGRWLPDVRPLALDFALPALFVALLVFQIKDRIQLMVAGLAGVGAAVLAGVGLGRWNVLAATVVAATLGLVIDRRTRKSR